MIKIICDRCGAEIEENENIGYVTINLRDGLHGNLLNDNPLEQNHYCVECMDKIYKFVMAEPVKDPAPEPIPKTKTKPTVKPRDILSTSPEPDKPKRRKIDIGKIMALKNAGWSYQKIGEEMGMSANAVGNAIWAYKKKMTERGASDEKDRKEDIAAILQGS